MPISQINEDGTVKIYNKNSGQVLDVKPEELANYNPALVGDYQSKLQEKQAAQIAAEQVKGGQLKISDIPDAQKVAVASQLTKSGYKPEQKQKDDTLASVNNLINNLEQHYQAAGGGEVDIPILSRIIGAGKDVQGKLGFNDSANVYNREKEGFAATLKGLTGDTGVLTDQDFQRLSKLLPSLGAKPEEAKALLNDLRSQIAAKYGGKAAQTSIDPKVKNLLEVIAPATSDYVKNQVQENQNLTPDEAVQKAQRLTSNTGAFGLPFLANLISGQKEAKDLVAPTAEVTGLVAAPGAIKGGLSFLKNIPGKIFSQGTGQAIRNEAIDVAQNTGVKVDGNKIYNAITKWADDAKRANPQAVKSIDNFVNGAEAQFKDKTLDPNTAKQLWDDASKGFTAAGTKGSSMVAGYHRAVRDVTRNVLEEVAPGFEKGTQLIRQGLQRGDTAKSAGKIAASTAVGGITSALLYNYLFGNKGN